MVSQRLHLFFMVALDFVAPILASELQRPHLSCTIWLITSQCFLWTSTPLTSARDALDHWKRSLSLVIAIGHVQAHVYHTTNMDTHIVFWCTRTRVPQCSCFYLSARRFCLGKNLGQCADQMNCAMIY